MITIVDGQYKTDDNYAGMEKMAEKRTDTLSRARDIADFLARGGQIQQIPPGVTKMHHTMQELNAMTWRKSRDEGL